MYKIKNVYSFAKIGLVNLD